MESLLKSPIMVSQLCKFFLVTFLIFKQYLRILYRYNLSRRFFMDLYYAYNNRIYDQTPSVKVSKIDPPVGRSIEQIDLIAIDPKLSEVCATTYNSYFQNGYDSKLLLVSDQELVNICTLVKYYKPCEILEIGTFRGGLTYNFLINSEPNCLIDTVDIHFLEGNSVIQSALEDQRINRIIKRSNKLELDKKYDFIFIDGGHNYADVKNDTELALKALTAGGMIIWHDYIEHEPGVFKYLEELSKKYKLRVIENSSLVLFHNI